MRFLQTDCAACGSRVVRKFRVSGFESPTRRSSGWGTRRLDEVGADLKKIRVTMGHEII